MSAFLMSAVPELAPACVAPYSGYLPSHVRFDAHKTHFPVAEQLGKVGVDAHVIGAYRPYRNGMAERLNSTIKGFFKGTLGHVDHYKPTDRLAEDPRTTRTKASATSQRVTRRRLIDPENLPRIEDFEAIILPKAIEAYNRTHLHEALGMTPHDAWHALSRRRDERRSGQALIRTLETHSVVVTSNAIKLERNGMPPVRFDAVVNGRLLLRGRTLTVHVHPLLKGLWSVEGDGGRWLAHLQPLSEAAAVLSASNMAKRLAAPAAGASEDAAAAQRAVLEHQLGAESVRRAEEKGERALAGDPDPRPTAPTPPSADLTPVDEALRREDGGIATHAEPEVPVDVDALKSLSESDSVVGSQPDAATAVIDLFNEHRPLTHSLAADVARAPETLPVTDTPT